MAKQPRPTHKGSRTRRKLHRWLLKGIVSPRCSIYAPEDYDENWSKRNAAAFACASLADGKPDANTAEVWRTSGRVLKWCAVVVGNAKTLAVQDMGNLHPSELSELMREIMNTAIEVRELCAAASRAMLLERAAVEALNDETTNTGKGV